MRNFIIFLFAISIYVWSMPKPMESITNYNVLMVHGAYGWNQGFIWSHMSEDYWKYQYGLEDVPIASLFSDASVLADVVKNLNDSLPSAYDATSFLGNANLGAYDNGGRITYWLNKNVFEDDSSKKPQTSYIYNWRSFSNPANSSSNNAHELGDRLWNNGNLNYGKGGFGHRRALTEEALEVKAVHISGKDTSYGQIALDSIRNHPDLYRQLASRYILIGHSMGGVVSREWIQNSGYYYGDVDKVITLDSPHEGIAALSRSSVILEAERRGSIISRYNWILRHGWLRMTL